MSDKPFFEQAEREIPDVEVPCVDYAERRGWFVRKVVSPGSRGFPDRFMARGGVIRLVEFKRGGEEPTDQQKKRHRELRAAGVDVRWYSDVESFKADFV